MDGIEALRSRLAAGMVIPACPLALNTRRRFDPRRQRAVLRYYRDAGAGGVAIGVHTTQFAIRNPKFGLFRPVLELAAETLREQTGGNVVTAPERPVAIAGICGPTPQAAAEAELAAGLGFDAGLLSLGALRDASESELIRHCRSIAGILPVVGFYLQPAAGGRLLSHAFWRQFAQIQNIVAIKIAPFNRYQTIDVVRAIAEAGRDDIALYTGNDDNIVLDLLTPYRFRIRGRTVERRIVGGLLGHWAVWTRRAVELHAACRSVATGSQAIPGEWLARNVEVTDMNAALFDAANGYAGCIPGVHEILRRNGLLAGTACLEPKERLSRGQGAELDRVTASYPHLIDDRFVEEHRDRWLR